MGQPNSLNSGGNYYNTFYWDNTRPAMVSGAKCYLLGPDGVIDSADLSAPLSLRYPGDRISTGFSDPNYNWLVVQNTNLGSYQSTVSTGSTAAPGHGYGVAYGALTSNATNGVGGQYRSSVDDSLLVDIVPWDTTKNRYVRQITLQSGWIRVICQNVPGTTPVKYVFNSVAAVSTVDRSNSQFRSTHAVVKQF